MLYWVAYALFWLVSKFLCPLTVEGASHIPPDGNFIFASNHLSNLDPVILGVAVGRRHKLHFMAKDSLFKGKILSAAMASLGAFPVRRTISDVRAIRNALKRLKRGQTIAIFPEGTRRFIEGAKNIQPGIGLLARKSQVPVVPVLISGSEKVLPPGARMFRPGRIQVLFGHPKRYPPGLSHAAIATDVVDTINVLSRSVARSSHERLPAPRF